MFRVALGLAVVVVTLVAARSEACTCNSSPVGPTGAGFPLNTAYPVLRSLQGDNPAFVSADGGLVPSSTAPIPGGVVLTPQRALTPATTWFVTTSEGRLDQLTFTTGLVVDDVAPATPALGAVTFTQTPLLSGNTCGSGARQFLSVEVTGLADDQTPGTELWLQGFTGPTEDTVDTSRVAAVAMPSLGTGAVFGLADPSVCGGNFPLSRTPDLALRVRAVDRAGNVSEWSAPLQLKTGGCACSSADASLMVVLLALFTRRFARR